MARRVEGELKMRCTHPRCHSETIRFYTSEARLREVQVERESWRCSDHDGSRVRLTPEVTEASSVLVLSHMVSPSVRNGRYMTLAGEGDYWGIPGGRATMGRVSGEGWFALAEDFPPGTRLEMTVRVVVPDAGDGAS